MEIKSVCKGEGGVEEDDGGEWVYFMWGKGYMCIV